MELKVYATQTNERLEYVLKCVLRDLCGLTYRLTNDPEELSEWKGPLLCYQREKREDVPVIWAEGLLEEKGLRNEKPSFDQSEGMEVLYPSPEGYAMPFDLFSAVFYLISRYEEYQVFRPDAHGRFSASESVLFKAGLLERPLVNEWAIALMRILKQRWPELELHPRRFEYISSLDIDQAWKYLNKGWLRNMGGYLRDLFQRDFNLLKERYDVMSGAHPDPYFNFEWQFELHQQFPEVRVQYFILLADRGKYDKNISHYNEGFIRLLEDLSKRYELGIHPSYRSNERPQLLKKEIHRLQDITQKEVHVSRQHFLIHQMPKTYLRLLEQGIREDHTMGYSTHMGFRAGIAAPFYFYDFEQERETELLLYPFCVMDITAMYYEGLAPEEAMNRHRELLERVRTVGGLFESLWHNESISENGRWKAWRSVYEDLFLQASKANEAHSGYR